MEIREGELNVRFTSSVESDIIITINENFEIHQSNYSLRSGSGKKFTEGRNLQDREEPRYLRKGSYHQA